MREISREELEKILDDHADWLKSGRKQGVRADLCEANLRGANLYGANLSETDLREAKLSTANLREANLNKANLNKANLNKGTLNKADLSEADLREADLREATLNNANLSRPKVAVSSVVARSKRPSDSRMPSCSLASPGRKSAGHEPREARSGLIGGILRSRIAATEPDAKAQGLHLGNLGLHPRDSA